MIKILFICHGNICRSPMAEYVFRNMAKKAGMSAEVTAASAATSTEEIGNPVYPPAKKLLRKYGITCEEKRAVQLQPEDYDAYDLLIGMDHANLRNMERICGGDQKGKMRLLMDYTRNPREVADPWYTNDFEQAYRDILEGCTGLLQQVTVQRGSTLTVTPAGAWQYPEVRDFYYAMIDGMAHAEYGPGWKKDIYPDPEMLQNALDGGNLYMGFADGCLAAAMILNHECVESYDDYSWLTKAAHQEALFVHALGVLPEFTGKGFGKEMVRFAINFARRQRLKTVRLDVLAGNVPAENLYPAVGFQNLGTVQLYYEDTGWTEYLLEELPLK